MVLVKLGDICQINKNTYNSRDKWKHVNYLDTGSITENKIDNIQYIDLDTEKLPSRAKRKVCINSILYSTVRPNQKHYGIVKRVPSNYLVSTGFTVIDVDTQLADPDFIYFYLTQPEITEQLQAIAEQSVSAYPSIKPSDIGNVKVNLLSIECQRKIAGILKNISDKIAINNQINKNLEEQLRCMFVQLFGEQISKLSSNIGCRLGDLVTIIDNRGKTPPLVTDTHKYPIIDVGALRGIGRIIDFNNCSKYVAYDTYNNWFRSGHPKNLDILISTVGSVAEMKLFVGTKGCIAQNVVALRCKTISPLYLYEYLNYIKADLTAYNIGSVQPSIKVTHIIKHPIFVPSSEALKKFHDYAASITETLYNLSNENRSLTSLRDTLLPKLMSGELDVSKLDL